MLNTSTVTSRPSLTRKQRPIRSSRPGPTDPRQAALCDLLRVMCERESRVLHIGALDPLPFLPVRGVHLDRDAPLTGLADLGPPFDHVILCDILHQADDPWAVLRAVRTACSEQTRVLICGPGPLGRDLLPGRHLSDLLRLTHFAVVRQGGRALLPGPLDRYLAEAPGLRRLAGLRYILCRPVPLPAQRQLSCSVIVPCKDERDNIAEVVSRTPRMGRATEIIFVDGGSQDGTVTAIESELSRQRRPDLTLRLLRQEGQGKGDAVRQGLAEARGDLLFVLDSDLTVMPEDLPKFYAAVAEGGAELVNGTRLVYPIERGAMRPLNRAGNYAFARLLSQITGQRLTDTLCGTKALLRRDAAGLGPTRRWLGSLDPLGDFDLLLHAARRGLKVAEVPVRYRARTCGKTKLRRLRDGALLLRLALRGLARLRGAEGVK